MKVYAVHKNDEIIKGKLFALPEQAFNFFAVDITIFLIFLFTGLITKRWKEAAISLVFFLCVDFVFIYVLFIAKFLAE